jgi:hypothetical protein
MNDPVNLDALSDFIGGVSDRVSPEDEWGIGCVIAGDTPAAGTAYHKGEKMDRSEYEQCLEEHRDERSPASAAEDTIVFNVVEADSEPFEQKRYGPDKERPA